MKLQDVYWGFRNSPKLPILLPMKNSDLPEEIIKGAYKIFLTEVTRHLNETRIVFCDDELPQPVIKDAKVRFHQIRGGAGFFGLSDIEDTARKMEKILKALSETGEGEVSALRILYEELEKHVSKISQPQETGA